MASDSIKNDTTWFPAEEYMSVKPPHHQEDWHTIVQTIIYATVTVVFFVPLVIKAIFGVQDEAVTTATTNESKPKSTSKLVIKKNVVSVTKHSKKRKKAQQQQQEKEVPTKLDATTATTATVTEVKVPAFLLPTVNFTFLVIVFLLIASSPNNIYSARQVFLSALLLPNECQHIINMAEEAASRNAGQAESELAVSPEIKTKKEIGKLEKILMKPRGWQKDRHEAYPTTDLNVVHDLQSNDRDYLEQILDARLSPLLERIYGVSRESIRANDMFVVRYDGDFGQQSLRRHTDSSHISFNVLLNDAFEGGGTRFHNRAANSYMDVKPQPGQVLINNALVDHEGLATKSGTRYILVGFMNIDRKNPFTGESLQLHSFASWFSFPWLMCSLNEAVKDLLSEYSTEESRGLMSSIASNSLMTKLLLRVILAFETIGDYYAPHGVVSLVDEKDTEQYIQALTVDYEQNKASLRKSTWFTGQHINVAFDGKVGDEVCIL